MTPPLAHLLFLIFFLCVFVAQVSSFYTFASIIYPTPSDCTAAASTFDYNGSCYASFDCNRGAINLTIPLENGFCQATDLGLVDSIGMNGYGFAEFYYSSVEGCQKSYNATQSTAYPDFTSKCSYIKTWYVFSQGGVLDTSLSADLVTFNFS